MVWTMAKATLIKLYHYKSDLQKLVFNGWISDSNLLKQQKNSWRLPKVIEVRPYECISFDAVTPTTPDRVDIFGNPIDEHLQSRVSFLLTTHGTVVSKNLKNKKTVVS